MVQMSSIDGNLIKFQILTRKFIALTLLHEAKFNITGIVIKMLTFQVLLKIYHLFLSGI